ncbi:MAG: DUF721 domain-containing protein [bacterium]
MWRLLKDILPKRGVRPSVAEPDSRMVCQLWQKYAGKAFLSRVSANNEAVGFRDGTLVVSVSDSLVADEVRAQQHKIASQINRELGRTAVNRIVVRG